jgi:hypothetical protein
LSRRAAGSSIPVGDKGLARLGDAFINLAFSYAKTKVKGKPFGEKVPDRVLSQALELAKIPVPTRLKHGQRGDMVESIIAYSWLSGLIGLEEATMVIASELSASDAISESRGLEREAAAKAFSRLVVLCVARVEKEGGAYWV